MADFLGSYYDSSELDGNELDERIISQRIAILNAEQPVSILDMDAIDSRKVPQRLNRVEKLGSETAPRKLECDDRFSNDEHRSSEDDFEIPVASMSMFDTEKPSMVSVQLQSMKSPNFKGPTSPTNQRPYFPSKRQREPPFSPLSDGKLGAASLDPRIPSRDDKTMQIKGANERRDSQEGVMKRKASVMRTSILKLFSRKQEQKSRKNW